MGKLSTHVLDTATGRPGVGVALRLYRHDAGNWQLVCETATNRDGRTDAPLLADAQVQPGRYRIVFDAGDYFRRCGVAMPEPPFVDQVTIDFGLAEPGGSYHVPLLVSPWSYATYRGS